MPEGMKPFEHRCQRPVEDNRGQTTAYPHNYADNYEQKSIIQPEKLPGPGISPMYKEIHKQWRKMVSKLDGLLPK